MYHFRYVTKKELSQTKKEITELIHCVQDKVREEFTFQYEFIGSTKRNMVTYDPESNVGFDFDVNIKVNGEVREHSPEEVKKF